MPRRAPGDKRERQGEAVVDVVIEVPRGCRNKYEYDPDAGRMRLTRTVPGTGFPADYGFVTGTLGEDGDPLDAVVLLEEPAVAGCVVAARAVGVLRMADEAGPDAKLVCVPAEPAPWADATGLDDVPAPWLHAIREFFEAYKEDEPGRWSRTGGFGGAEEAEAHLARARERATAAGPPGAAGDGARGACAV